MADNTVQVHIQLVDEVTKQSASVRRNVERDLTGMNSAAGKAAVGFGQLGGSIKSSMLNAVSFLGPASIAAAGVTTAFRALKESLNFADMIANLNAKFGISTTMIQQLDYIAKQSGGSVENMALAFKALQAQMFDAGKAGSTADKLFKALGVTVTDNETTFKDSIKALAGIEDETTRAAAATQLFGRAALEILPNIEALNKEFSKSKTDIPIFDPETVKTLDDIGDAMERMWKGFVVWTGKAVSALWNFENAKAKIWGSAFSSFGPKKFVMAPGVDDSQAGSAGSQGQDDAAASRQKAVNDALITAQKDGQKATIQSYEQFQQEEEAFRIRAEAETRAALAKKEIDDYDRRANAFAAELQQTTDANQSMVDADRVYKEQLAANQAAAIEEKKRQAQVFAQIEQNMVGATMSATRSLADIGRLAVTNSKANANEKKNILTGLAVAEGAASIITAVKAGWDSGITYWDKAALAVAGGIAAGAQTIGQIATIRSQRFEQGGIVAGSSTTGDRIPIRANAGEMVLTRQHQANLLAIANGRGGGGRSATINIYDQSGNLVDKVHSQLRRGNGDAFWQMLDQRYARA